MSSIMEDTREYVELVISSLDRNSLDEHDNARIIGAVSEERYSDAESSCIHRIKADKKDYFALSIYGLVLMLRGELTSASDAIHRALQIDMDRVLAWNLLGDHHFKKGNKKDGIAAYHLSLDRVDEQLHPRKMLYHHYMAEKKFQRALRAIEPALKVNPDDDNIWRQLRDCVAQLGYVGFAEGVIYQLERNFPQKHMTWYLRGNLLLELDKLEDAEIAVRKAIELQSKDSLTWALLATILNQMGRTEEAIECCQEAVRIDPENPYTWYSYSMLLLKIGKQIESRNAASRAVALNPKKAKEILRYLSRDK